MKKMFKCGALMLSLLVGGLISCSPGEEKQSLVNSEISKIEVEKLPNKTIYQDGDRFNATGLVIKVTYKDGTVIHVRGENLDNTDVELKTGMKSVSLSYEGKTFEVEITVNAKKPIKTFTFEAEEFKWEKPHSAGTDKITNDHEEGNNSTGNNYIGHVDHLVWTSTLAFESSEEAYVNISAALARNGALTLKDEIQVFMNGHELPLKASMNQESWVLFQEIDLFEDIPIVKGINHFIIYLYARESVGINFDYFKFSTTSELSKKTIIKSNYEAEKCNFEGVAKICPDSDQNNPSNGQCVGGLGIYENGGLNFKVNANKKCATTMMMNLGLCGDEFNLRDWSLQVNSKGYETLSSKVSKASEHTWFDWAIVYIGTIELEEGENSIRLTKGESAYGSNIDYLVFHSSEDLTFSK